MKKLIYLFLILLSSPLFSQIQVNGPVYISENSFIYVDSNEIYFNNDGQIITERTSNFGQFILSGTSYLNPSIAINQQFIDGYLSKTINQSTVFPIGQNLAYAPSEITPTKLGTFTAAFYNQDPNVFSNNLDTTLTQLSTLIYWELTGDSAMLRFGWSSNDLLLDFPTTSKIELTLAGYNPSSLKWELIPSFLDSISLFNTISDLYSGSFSTIDTLKLANYSAFSIAKKSPCEAAVTPVLDLNQPILPGMQLSEIVFSNGFNVWYETPEDAFQQENALDNSSVLVDNTTYYIVNQESDCPSEILEILISNSTNSITPISSNLKLKIYPNPSSNGIFTLQLDFDLKDGDIIVKDLSGRSIDYRHTSLKDKIQIELQEAPGIYILEVNVNDQFYRQKLVVK